MTEWVDHLRSITHMHKVANLHTVHMFNKSLTTISIHPSIHLSIYPSLSMSFYAHLSLSMSIYVYLRLSKFIYGCVVLVKIVLCLSALSVCLSLMPEKESMCVPVSLMPLHTKQLIIAIVYVADLSVARASLSGEPANNSLMAPRGHLFEQATGEWASFASRG